MKLGTEYRIKNYLNRTGIHTVLILISITCVFPLYWMFLTALRTQETVFSDMRLIVTHPQWKNFWEALTTGGFSGYFFNSVIYTISVVLGVLILTTLAAYAFARLEFPGKKILR